MPAGLCKHPHYQRQRNGSIEHNRTSIKIGNSHEKCTMKNNTLLLIASVLFCLACNHTQPLYTKYRTKGNHFIVETYKGSKLYSTQSFDKDSIPDGPGITYFPNGKIEKWKWFDINQMIGTSDSIATFFHDNRELSLSKLKKNDQYPVCMAYYDSTGKFDTLVGYPLVERRYNNGIMAIGIAYPPSVYAKIILTDSEFAKVTKQYLYEPEPADALCWVPLTDLKYQKGHIYYLEYMLVDKSDHFYMSTGVQLFNDKLDKAANK